LGTTNFPDDQVDELIGQYPGVAQAEEGGIVYFLLPDLEMPAGCAPARVDALLCPTTRDGYASRLYVADKVTGGPSQNWNATGVRILERNWHAVSWRTREGLRLAQMVRVHLDAFRTRAA
jgi:hypothetical protein